MRPPKSLREIEKRNRAEAEAAREPRFNMRHPEFLDDLAAMRLHVVASWDDPMWDSETKAQARNNRAFQMKTRQEVLIKPFTITYKPPHPLDFREHPEAFLTLDMLGFYAQSRQGPVTPRMYRWNQLFFVVDRPYVQKMLRGERTTDDLLDFLYKTNVS